jgi:hypothetical protein
MTMTDTVDQRITLAREYLDEARGRSVGTELPRLILERELAETRRHLGQVLAVIDGLAPAVLAGNYDLTPAQVATVLAAVADAVAYRTAGADAWCEDCMAHPAGCCDRHADDLDQAGAYRQLARELGGQR